MSGTGALPEQRASYPTLLVIDAEAERAQRLARLLTLAGYHALVAETPFQALQRLLEEPFFPDALLMGQIDAQARQSVLPRLMQRLSQRREAVPTLAAQAEVPAEPPLRASATSPQVHTPSLEALRALAPIWQMLPQTRYYTETPLPSQVLKVLPDYGLRPRVSQERRSRNRHFRQVLRTAYELMDADQWERLMGDVGLARYRRLTDWPVENDVRGIPAEYLSLLHQAVAFSNPADSAGQVRRWSDRGTQISLQRHNLSSLTRQMLKLLPQERLMRLVLERFAREINEIRGEELHYYLPWSDGSYRLVHYSNLYVYGRLAPPAPACQVWLAALEATLRFVGLDTSWEVSEEECSCQTQTGHCLFAIRPRAGS